MSKQWHPLFAHLLRLLLDRYYSVQTEVPVSELPRRSDIFLLRRQTAEVPPFVGLWSNLTEWNALEFKGPGDSAHEDDLELLLHVGTGLTVRFNEERVAARQERLPNRQVSLWYIAPTLGETFLGHARTRTAFDYQTGGLWRGLVWGHPVWLVSARDLPVEVDTLPLRLLDRDPPAPRAVGELVVGQEELLRRFATWLHTLQPVLWEEVRQMANTSTGIIDWEAVSRVADLDEVVRFLPPQHVIEVLGAERALQIIGLPRVIEAIGLPRVIEVVGLPRVVEVVGPEQLLQELLKLMPPEQVQAMLQRQQSASGDKGADQGPPAGQTSQDQ